MEIGVCVKRVPQVGGRIVLTPDGQGVDTRMSGFAISPHEECAVEEAVRLTERLGGSVSVLTLGPAEAAEQLRDALALGAHRGVLLETDGREWGPAATAAAIVAEARRRAADGPAYQLLLFGNEAADTGDYQVGVRVASALGWPCATGIKHLDITGDVVRARREYRGTEETYEFSLPAVITVKEGINLPRYPSLPGRAAGQAGGDRAAGAAVAAGRPAHHRPAGPGGAAAAGRCPRPRPGRRPRPGQAPGRTRSPRVSSAGPGGRPPGTPRESLARRGHASGAPRLASSAGPGGRPPGTPRESLARRGHASGAPRLASLAGRRGHASGAPRRSSAGPGGRPPGTPRESLARRGHASGAPRLASSAGPGGRPPGTPRESLARRGHASGAPRLASEVPAKEADK